MIPVFLFISENVGSIEKCLNADFNSLCEWFIDNLYIWEKIKPYVFYSKRETTSTP